MWMLESYITYEGYTTLPAYISYSPGDTRTSLHPSPPSGGTVNWNRHFQELLHAEDSYEKWIGLSNLAKDFLYVTEVYGRIIISELFCDQKTVPPSIEVGGFAGGTKYITQGILFKFALDKLIPETQIWLYGHTKRSDELAMASSVNELKGLSAYFFCDVPNLHFPLMTRIHYRGYLLMAVSLLPISSKTLAYGSSDAGKTVVDNYPPLSSAMMQVGKILNLKPHLVGNVTIYGTADIEGHCVKIDKDKYEFYVCDLARVMPPEYFKDGTFILSKLLRPSFVKNYKNVEPLCSDAGTGFCVAEEREQLEEAIKKATEYLHEAIKQYAIQLLASDREFTLKQLVDDVHMHGFNIRHLGLIRSHMHSSEMAANPLRSLILTEMVARVMKNELRRLMRDTMSNKIKIATEHEYLSVTYNYLEKMLLYRVPAPHHLSVPIQYPRDSDDSDLMKIIYNGSEKIDLPTDCPPLENEPFYMEVTILSSQSIVSIGLCHFIKHYIPQFQLSSNGKILAGKKEYLAVQCKDSDTFGMYYYYSQSQKVVVFTINGSTFGTVFHHVPTHLSAVVTLGGPATIKCNFGTDAFKFDIIAFTKTQLWPAPSHSRVAYRRWWNQDVKNAINSHFPGKALSKREEDTQQPLRGYVNMPLLLSRFKNLSGVVLSKRIKQSIFSCEPTTISMNIHDIKRLEYCSHFMDFLVVANSMCTLTSIERGVGLNPEIEVSVLKESLNNILTVLKCYAVNQPRYQYYTGSFYLQLALRTKGEQRREYLSNAQMCFEVTPENQCDNRFIPKLMASLAKVKLLQIRDRENNDNGSWKQLGEDENNELMMHYKLAFQNNGVSFLLSILENIKQQIMVASSINEILGLVEEARVVHTGFPRDHLEANMKMLALYIQAVATTKKFMKGIAEIQNSIQNTDTSPTTSVVIDQFIIFAKLHVDAMVTKDQETTLSDFILDFLKGTIDHTNLESLLLVCLKSETLARLTEKQIEKLQVLQIINRKKISKVIDQFKEYCKNEIVERALANPLLTAKVANLFEEVVTIISEGPPGGLQTALSCPIRCRMVISKKNKRYQINLSTGFIVDPDLVRPVGDCAFLFPNALHETQGDVKDFRISIPPLALSQFKVKMSTIVIGKTIDDYQFVQCVVCNTPKPEIHLILHHNLCTECCRKHCWKCYQTLTLVPEASPKPRTNQSVGLCDSCYGQWACSLCFVQLTQRERQWKTGLCNKCYDKWACARCNKLLSKDETSYATGLCNVCWDFYHKN